MTQSGGAKTVPPLVVWCDEETWTARRALLRAGREALSIVETSPKTSGTKWWCRGHVKVTHSVTTIVISGSSHFDLPIHMRMDCIELKARSEWIDTVDRLKRMVQVLHTLCKQSLHESSEEATSPIHQINDTLSAAATNAGFTAADVMVMAPGLERPAAYGVYHDGPTPFTLHPVVERTIMSTLPIMVRVDFSDGTFATRMVTFTDVEIDEQVDHEPMDALRKAKASGLTSAELELRHEWPQR